MKKDIQLNNSLRFLFIAKYNIDTIDTIVVITFHIVNHVHLSNIYKEINL